MLRAMLTAEPERGLQVLMRLTVAKIEKLNIKELATKDKKTS